MSVEVGDVIHPVLLAEDTSVLVQTEKDISLDVVTATPVADIESEFCVEAQIQEWVLTSDDIYIVSQTEALPPWMEELINQVVESPDGLIVQDINDLYGLIESLEEGFTKEIFRVDNELYTQTTSLESLKSSYDDTAAIVVEINDTYASAEEARAISWDVTGAYFDEGNAAAWFESSVSAVANVAYSAARSASSLNASIITTNALTESIGLDVEILKKQVDGQIVTWFIDEATDATGIGPFLPDGSINPNFKPYWCWLEGNECLDFDEGDTLEDTRAYHTGDVLVWYRFVDEVKTIIFTAQFGLDPSSGLFNWFIFTDDLASAAYEAALLAQATADSKIVTYYQNESPEFDVGVVLGVGDFWVDADGFYVEGQDQLGDYPFKNTNILSRWNGTSWDIIEDARISASVQRIDEATVNVNGIATAKGSLVTTAEGYVSGYVTQATNDPADPGSIFKIFADKFFISGEYDADYPLAGFTAAPFSVDTTVSPNVIKFNGVVEFDNILNPVPVDLSAYMTLDYGDEFYTRLTDLSVTGRTVINGNNITTGLLNASLIRTGILDATYITAGVMSADRVRAGTLTAVNITGNVIVGNTIIGKNNWIDAGNSHYGQTTYAASINHLIPNIYTGVYTNIGYTPTILLLSPTYGTGYFENRLTNFSTSKLEIVSYGSAIASIGGNVGISHAIEYNNDGISWKTLAGGFLPGTNAFYLGLCPAFSEFCSFRVKITYTSTMDISLKTGFTIKVYN